VLFFTVSDFVLLFAGQQCQYNWELLRRARCNNRLDSKTKNKSGIARKKMKKPYKYAEQMSFLDNVNAKEKQEGNLDSDLNGDTENETDMVTDCESDATEFSINLCNSPKLNEDREKLNKDGECKNIQRTPMAMSSMLSDISCDDMYSEQTLLNVSYVMSGKNYFGYCD